MRGLLFDTKEIKLNLKADIPEPEILLPTDVIVAPKYVGVCGTDLHIVKGEFPSCDIVLGHEICGTVVAVGENVKHVKPGDAVGIDPNLPGCGGVCEACGEGKPQLCAFGLNYMGITNLHGGFAQFTHCTQSQVYKLPAGQELENAFLIETLSVIYHGRELLGPLHKPNARVLILGAGIVGLIWGSLLHHEGFRNIVISEPKASRRKTAEALDVFDEVFDPSQLTDFMCTKNRKGGCYFDVVVDCCGVAAAINPTLPWLKRGGTLLLFACAPPSQNLKLNLELAVQHELKVQGAVLNPHTYGRSVALALQMQERYLNLEKLGVRKFTMEQHAEAFAALNNGDITKGVFVIE